MLKIEKYGAIDIGSNAIRLLISTVTVQEHQEPSFKKTSLVRVPIRLGTDVFLEGKISKYNYLRMKDALRAFSLLMKIHQVNSYRACATSAMRDASNSDIIIQKLYKKTGISIDVIDGQEEADIIASTHIREYLKHDKVFLYVDVGGGSTELTLYANSETVASKSFKIGTVRLLNDLVEESIWDELKSWIKENTKGYSHISLLGTGGNINSTYKKSGLKMGKPMNYLFLKKYYKNLSICYEMEWSKFYLCSKNRSLRWYCT